MMVFPAKMLDIGEEEYRRLPGINWHSLEPMSTSPAQYKWDLAHPSHDTKALSLGRVVHIALLDTEIFLKRKTVDKHNRGTKGFVLAQEGNPDSIVISASEEEMIMTHIERFQRNEYYCNIIENSYVERSIKWQHAETGLLLKGRPDVFNSNILADVKTSRHIGDRRWWRDFKDLKYHCQFAYYLDGLFELDGKNRICVCIKVETSPCFDVVVYPLPWEAIAEGRHHYESLLRQLKDCLDVNGWPGKSNELAEVRFDNWKIEKEYFNG